MQVNFSIFDDITECEMLTLKLNKTDEISWILPFVMWEIWSWDIFIGHLIDVLVVSLICHAGV